LPAIAAAQLLLFALYARQITLAPNLAQGVGLATYLLAVALLSGAGRLGFLALVLANSAQWIVYALLLLWLLRRSVSLGGLGLGAEIGKMAIASALMYLAVGRLLALLTWAPAPVAVALGAGAGVFVYLGICTLLRVRALGLLASIRPRTA
jgi:putative peptidoglycan lipid II flippase